MSNIPIEISARHVHLSADAWKKIFGDQPMTVGATISQPPQFLAAERVTLRGPKGEIDRVGIVGPVRAYTQVELAATDARKLGLTPPLSESGQLEGAALVTITGPNGSIDAQAAILQRRHIHAHPKDCETFGLHEGQEVSVQIGGPRGGVLEHVLVRVHPDFSWRLHLDTDEANALGVTPTTTGEVLST